MKLIVNKDRSVIPIGTWGTKNENDFEILDFEFPEELDEYNKRIVYYLDDERVWDAIVDNKAYITNAITTKSDVKAYVWCTKENTEREADTDFRTMLFDMHFYENENADGIVPTPEQVDGFNTMLTAMNNKIDEVDALETTIETAEAERQEAEATRVSNENTRESNESTRQTNEQTRQTQEAERERRTDEAIADIEDKTAEYNANAEEKTNEFNDLVHAQELAIENYGDTQLNAIGKKGQQALSSITTTTRFALQDISLAQQTGVSAVETASSEAITNFNTNATNKTNAFNNNATEKTTAFNDNASTKTSEFNTNAESKTSAFNDNATQKTTNFDNNASEKTDEFNTNAESKTSAFNDNATQKTTNFDNNASEKTDEFNTNAQEKIDEYDEHIVEYQAQIDELQEEVDELSENMPWNTTEQATEIQVTDAAKYSKNKLELFGNTEQPFVLPPNYTPLDYIESTGTQYIDTGVATSNTIKVEAEVINTFGFIRNNRTYGGALFGGRKSSTNSNFSYVTGDAHDYVGKGNNFIEIDKNVNTDLLKIQYDTSSVNIECGNYKYINNNLSINITNSFNIYIFANNQDNTIASYGTFKLYKFKIYDNDTLVRDFVPCKNENNEGGLFDLVSNTFFTNQGTGTFTLGNEIKSIHVVTGNNTISVGNTDYPINLGSIELCKIGDYQDYLYKENGNWYKYGAINKIIFNGTESWSNEYTAFSKTALPKSIASSGAYCNHYMYDNRNSNMSTLANYNFAIQTRVSVNSSTVFIQNTDVNSVENFKTLLSSNNVSVYYPLATPTSTQITDETLISQLDAIYEHLQLVKGTNNITVTAEDLAPYMELTYMQDLPSKLDNLDSRLALLE